MKEEIRKLDAKYSESFTLHKLNEYTTAEISELLDIPERIIKYRINKAIQILKRVLREGEDD